MGGCWRCSLALRPLARHGARAVDAAVGVGGSAVAVGDADDAGGGDNGEVEGLEVGRDVPGADTWGRRDVVVGG